MIKTLREANEKKYYVAKRTYDSDNIYINGDSFDDELYNENCFTFGGSIKDIGNQVARNLFREAFDEDRLVSFQDFLDGYGSYYTQERTSSMSEDEQWESYLRAIKYFVLDPSVSDRDVEKIANACKDIDYSYDEKQEIGILILNTCLGGNWKVTGINGSVQGEHLYLCYNSDKLDEIDINVIEMICFNTYDSFMVTEDTYTMEEIENGAYYYFNGGKHRFNSGMVCDVFDWDKTKEEIANQVGCNPDEIYIVDEY